MIVITGYNSKVKRQILALRLASTSKTRLVHYADLFQDSVEKVSVRLLHSLQGLRESVQTTVYLFKTSDATMQICPMTLTLAVVGTLDPVNTGVRGAPPTNDSNLIHKAL